MTLIGCLVSGSLSLDLHVLGTPPAFILSQDQTLIKNLSAQLSHFEISGLVCICGLNLLDYIL